MRNLRWTARAALPAMAALALAGCGMFKSSGIDRYDANDANRVAQTVNALVTNVTPFTAAPPATASFTAILYDASGRQFYGPDVVLDGTSVPVVNPGEDRASTYTRSDVPYAAGQVYTMAVQGHTATTPAAPAPLKITSPVPATDSTGAALNYFTAQPGEPVTITWSGGDPSQDVYIVLFGSPDGNSPRRFFVADDPAQKDVTDPTYYGRPIANTGSYTIPAQLTERGGGPINVFDNPNGKGGNVNVMTISVLQRRTADSGPIHFSVGVVATAGAGVDAYK